MPQQGQTIYSISSVVASCTAAGGVLTCKLNRVGSGPIQSTTVSLLDSTGTVVSSAAGTYGQSNPVVFSSLSDDVYSVELDLDDGGGTGSSGGTYIDAYTDATISCGPIIAALDITVDRVDNPTVRGGLGNVRLNVANALGAIAVDITLNPPGPVTRSVAQAAGGIVSISGLAAGYYGARVTDAGRTGTGASDGVPFQLLEGPLVGCMDPAADNYDPLATSPGACTFSGGVWLGVGGVLTNPAIMRCRVSSMTRAVGGVQVPRVNLHIEVELFFKGEITPFARARQTVRSTMELVDVSRYLRPQLRPRLAYGRPAAGLDDDAAVTFFYRYREVDSVSVGGWITPVVDRYAVLMALPEATDSPEAYLASAVAPGRFTTQFATPTQFVGLPLELGVLLPARPAGLTLWAEVAYLDAAGAVIERRAAPVADTVPAGYLRVSLPDDPLPCAVMAEVALVDADRSFIGTCPPLGGGAGTPVVTPPVVVPLLNIRPGRLKL